MVSHPEGPHHRLDGGPLAASISDAIVRLLVQTTGRGPTKARTTLDRDLVVVTLQDTLARGEAMLARNGRRQQVLEMRAAYQDVMRDEAIAKIEELTRRTVVAFMSTNHIEPDLGVEVFVLEPENGEDAS